MEGLSGPDATICQKGGQVNYPGRLLMGKHSSLANPGERLLCYDGMEGLDGYEQGWPLRVFGLGEKSTVRTIGMSVPCGKGDILREPSGSGPAEGVEVIFFTCGDCRLIAGYELCLAY